MANLARRCGEAGVILCSCTYLPSSHRWDVPPCQGLLAPRRQALISEETGTDVTSCCRLSRARCLRGRACLSPSGGLHS